MPTRLPAERFAERLVEAVQARDVEGICAMHHPDIELEAVTAGGTVIRGRAEARRLAERLIHDDPMLTVSLGIVEPLADDLVLVRLQLRVSLPPSGHKVDGYVLLWQWRDGLLWRQYAGSEAQLRAKAAQLLGAPFPG